MTAYSNSLCRTRTCEAFLPTVGFLLTAIAMLGIATVRAQSVPESGFETPAVTGSFDYNPNDPTPGQSAWTYGGASGIASFPGPFSNFLTAPEGSQVALLQSFGSGSSASVCQSVGGFQTGVEYFIRAKIAHRVGCGSCSGPVDLHFEVDSNNAGNVAAASIPSDQFATFSGWFVASATQAQLCVVEPPGVGSNDSTNFVDDVHVGIFHIFIDGFEAPI